LKFFEAVWWVGSSGERNWRRSWVRHSRWKYDANIVFSGAEAKGLVKQEAITPIDKANSGHKD
jgi:hypothetical protein